MKIALFFLIIIPIFFLAVWFSTYHPQAIEPASIACTASAPKLEPGQKLKILSWNVQFMAGKNYIFFFDLIDHSGPDICPTVEDINQTMGRIRELEALPPSNHLRITYPIGGFKDIYKSQHTRADSTQIELHHLFLCFDFPD